MYDYVFKAYIRLKDDNSIKDGREELGVYYCNILTLHMKWYII